MRIAVVLILTMGLVGRVGAQTKVLTFEESVRIAMKNSVTLNQQRNLLEVNQMQKTASYVAMGPNLSLNSTAVRIDGNSFNPQTGTVVNGVRDNITGTLNGNINLFSGFRAINSVKQNTRLLDAQAYNVNRVTQDVINTVATQYLTVMLTRNSIASPKRTTKPSTSSTNK